MIPHLVYYQLVILGLLWLCVMLYLAWPSQAAASPQRPAEPTPIKPKRKRSPEPKPFAGLTHKPHCALCEQETAHPQGPPPVQPDPIPPTHRRPRTVDTSRHFCPHRGCRYRGWLGLGNLRANGHPNGGPWRQCHCTACKGSFPEHHGTIFQGKPGAVELIVRVMACMAEGLGIRATARVFEVAPNTGLRWLVEAAEQLRAFSAYVLCEVHVNQVQLDELYAVLREVKDGTLSEDEAIKRLERSRHWVWTAIDPESKLLVATASGPNTKTRPSGSCHARSLLWHPPACGVSASAVHHAAWARDRHGTAVRLVSPARARTGEPPACRTPAISRVTRPPAAGVSGVRAAGRRTSTVSTLKHPGKEGIRDGYPLL